MKDIWTKRMNSIIAVALFFTSALPCIFINSHHDCHYDECSRIIYKFNIGMCMEKAIDNLYLTIAIVWFMVVYGSCIILSKSNAISPFVIIALVLAVSVWGAFIDPSKWNFVISIMPSAIILFIANVVDKNKGSL